MDMVFIVAMVAFIVLVTCMCCRGKRAKPMFSAPVIVTTEYAQQPMPGGGGPTIVTGVPVMASAHAFGHTGPSMMQHTQYQVGSYPSQQLPYLAQQAAGGVGVYPMPQPQQQAQVYAGQAPYPMPRPHDNPPTYDQVAAAGTDAYQKQAPYNPNFQ